MRIPSQLNDETLYGRRGRRSQSSQPYRRLIRLSVALALVVVVMQQASQPGMYETFFGDDDWEAENVGSGASQLTPSVAPVAGLDSLASQTNHNVSEIPAATQSTAQTITQSLSVNEQRQWTVVLAHWQSDEEVRVIKSMVDAMIDVVKQSGDISDKERLAWGDTFSRFAKTHAAADEIFSDAVDESSLEVVNESDTSSNLLTDEVGDSQRLSALLRSLDQAATERVVDGALWHSNDFDAFYRQLDQAKELPGAGAMVVSVVPLMQQPKTYLGQRIRVAGRVARAENKEAAANPFGVKNYWELWLRPSTGGDRPFVLIVPDVPPSVKKLDGEMNIGKGPEIKVIGRFFKRLAFGSQYGADAAPVIIGRVLGVGNAPAKTMTSQSATRRGSSPPGKSLRSQFFLILGMALIVGITIASFVMWRTKVLAGQSRQLRQAGYKTPDLSVLSEIETDETNDVDTDENQEPFT